MTRPYTGDQALAIVRACHTVGDIDIATDRLYQYAPYFSLFELHVISQVIYYRRIRLTKKGTNQ